jgi:hypothetical protein
MIRIWQLILILWYVGGFIIYKSRMWDDPGKRGSVAFVYIFIWFITIFLITVYTLSYLTPSITKILMMKII